MTVDEIISSKSKNEVIKKQILYSGAREGDLWCKYWSEKEGKFQFTTFHPSQVTKVDPKSD